MVHTDQPWGGNPTATQLSQTEQQTRHSSCSCKASCDTRRCHGFSLGPAAVPWPLQPPCAATSSPLCGSTWALVPTVDAAQLPQHLPRWEILLPGSSGPPWLNSFVFAMSGHSGASQWHWLCSSKWTLKHPCAKGEKMTFPVAKSLGFLQTSAAPSVASPLPWMLSARVTHPLPSQQWGSHLV